MHRHAVRFSLSLVSVACCGCKAVVDKSIDVAYNGTIGLLCGESSEEKTDRHKLESYRDQAKRSGRPSSQADAEKAFREAEGRDPNVNWHAK